MTTSHADNHDQDKLVRWYRDLCANPSSPPLQRGVRGDFPTYAMFLVSEQDRLAHDIFRQFRSSFEARAAEYKHLTIFGQHGVSSTLRGLLTAFGLADTRLPLLLLFAEPSATRVYVRPLPCGNAGAQQVGATDRAHLQGPDLGWAEVLAGIERAAAAGAPGSEILGWASFPALTAYQLPGNAPRGVVGLVGQVLQSLGGPPS